MGTAAEDMLELDKILDDYEKGLGLPTVLSDNAYEDIQKYLSMSRDQLEALSQEDAVQIRYRLNSFAAHLGRNYNREIARVNWANSMIEETIADEINNYHGYGYKEKAPQAIKHNSYAQALNDISRYAKQRADRIGYMSVHIKDLSETLKDIARVKYAATKD